MLDLLTISREYISNNRAYSRKSGPACDFSEKGQKKGKKYLKRAKKDKIFENLGKNVQNLKIF